jgi:WhiB family redox-sensing transcriptional regulator
MAAIETSYESPFPHHLHDWLTQDRSWRHLAACTGRLALFFGPRAERPQARERRERQAKLLCDRCPVMEQCRNAARSGHEYGFWGGESEDDRHRAGFTVAAPIGVRSRLSVRAEH